MKSSFLRLNWFDLGKGLVVAIVAPALVVIQSVWSTGVLDLDWKQLLSVGLAGGLAYLIKNLFTDNKPSDGVVKEVSAYVGSRPQDVGR
jgi:hypothetical protein